MEKEIARLERKIDKLIEKAYRPLWVKSTVITSLTGWNKYGLRDAREYGYLRYEIRQVGDKKEYWYDLHSLPEKLIKQTA